MMRECSRKAHCRFENFSVLRQSDRVNSTDGCMILRYFNSSRYRVKFPQCVMQKAISRRLPCRKGSSTFPTDAPLTSLGSPFFRSSAASSPIFRSSPSDVPPQSIYPRSLYTAAAGSSTFSTGMPLPFVYRSPLCESIALLTSSMVFWVGAAFA